MKKKILIVEDEVIIARSLKLWLEKLGYNVLKTVSVGEDAIKSSEQNKPDIILMDVRLRGTMNGYEAVSIIRRHSDTPAIYLTGDDVFKIEEKAKNTEPYDYNIKPFDFNVLEKTIKKLLDEQSSYSKTVYAKIV